MKVACIQIKSTERKRANLRMVFAEAEKAVKRGARILSFPEHFLFLGKKYYLQAEKIPGKTTDLFCAFAKTHKVVLVLGSHCEVSPHSKKPFNTVCVINEKGKITGKYRKRNLFRANLPVYRKKSLDETSDFLRGNGLPVFSVFGYRNGIGVCFDLRFSDHFKTLCEKKVDIIFLPSAFTYETGKAHWEVLLRARAIETQAYVIAANQFGYSAGNGIHYYGHSMIVDPWGNKIKEAGEKRSAILIDDIQKKTIQKVRSKILLS